MHRASVIIPGLRPLKSWSMPSKVCPSQLGKANYHGRVPNHPGKKKPCVTVNVIGRIASDGFEPPSSVPTTASFQPPVSSLAWLQEALHQARS